MKLAETLTHHPPLSGITTCALLRGKQSWPNKCILSCCWPIIASTQQQRELLQLFNILFSILKYATLFDRSILRAVFASTLEGYLEIIVYIFLIR
jgi:hypothetical protein